MADSKCSDSSTKSMMNPWVLHFQKLGLELKCSLWAPQVYFVGEAVKKLKAEVARGAKLKCSKCGLRGAALGCFVKSCQRSYHVTCAIGISRCRWDRENFLLLCPAHCSVKFPDGIVSHLSDV